MWLGGTRSAQASRTILASELLEALTHAAGSAASQTWQQGAAERQPACLPQAPCYRREADNGSRPAWNLNAWDNMRVQEER